MSAASNNDPGEIKSPAVPTGPQDKDKQMPDKIVIPDECGDSLWDDVLAQYPAEEPIKDEN